MMVGIALTVACSPHSLAAGGFILMANVGLTPSVVIVTFLVAGWLRMAALYANGHWPVYGPWCRAAGAFVGVLVWAQMFLSMVKWSETSGFVPLGVPVYVMLTAGEIVSLYRAARDGRAATR